MNMRKENVIDVRNVEILLLQRINQQCYAVICSSIDERGATVLNDQVTRILQWPRILCVDGRDAII